MTLLPGVGALREFSAHAGVHCFLWARAAPCAFVQQPAASPTVGTGVPWGAATHSWHRASALWRDDLLPLHTRAHLEAAQSCDVGVRCSHAEEPQRQERIPPIAEAGWEAVWPTAVFSLVRFIMGSIVLKDAGGLVPRQPQMCATTM